MVRCHSLLAPIGAQKTGNAKLLMFNLTVMIKLFSDHKVFSISMFFQYSLIIL